MKKSDQKTKAFWGVFLFLIIQFFIYGQSRAIDYMNVYYVLDFHFGVVTRAVVGQIFNMIFPGKITAENIAMFSAVFMLLNIIVLSCFLGKFLQSDSSSRGRALFLLLVGCSPLGMKSFLRDLGRPDEYLLLLTMLGLLVCLTKISLNIKMLILSAISAICFAIHSAYISFMFPILLIYVLYEFTEKKRTFLNWICLALSAVIILGSFFYFQFAAKITADSYEQMCEYLLGKTELKLELDRTVQYFYFLSMKQNMLDFMINRSEINLYFNWVDLLRNQCILLISMLPLFFVFAYLWKEAMKKNQKVRMLFVMSPLSFFVVVYVTAVDWCRWSGFFVFTMTLAFCIFYMEGNEGFLAAFEKLEKKVNNYRFLFLSMICYLLGFEFLRPYLFNDDILFIGEVKDAALAWIIFVGIYSFIVFKCLFCDNVKTSRLDILLGEKEKRIAQYVRIHKTKIIRKIVYTGLVTSVFFVVDFWMKICQEGESLFYIFIPFCVIWGINLVYVTAIEKLCVKIRQNSKIRILSLLRYLVAAVLWVLGTLWLSGSIVGGVGQTVYLIGNIRLLQWILPLTVSLLPVLRFSESRNAVNWIKKRSEILPWIAMAALIISVLYIFYDKSFDASWLVIRLYLMQIIGGIMTVAAVFVYSFQMKKNIPHEE